MTAPGPAQPAPGTPASPTPGAPAAPTPAGGQVNQPVPAPQQPAPQQPAAPVAPQQSAPQLPAAQQPAALPAGSSSAALPVPAAQAVPPVPAAQTAAPPSAPAAPAAPPPRTTKNKATSTSGRGGGGYLVAVFALIIAVIAAGAAAYSLKISLELRDGAIADRLTEATPTADASATAGPAATTDGPTPTQTVPAGPQYTPELVRAELRVPNPTGCTAAYVDVDTGNVGVDSGHEFYLSRCRNPGTLQVYVDRTSGRSTSNANPSAEECAALVAGTPTSELVLQAESGVTFCLLTNLAQADAANLPQRLAIVEVLTVTTSQVRLALSTFRVED